MTTMLIVWNVFWITSFLGYLVFLFIMTPDWYLVLQSIHDPAIAAQSVAKLGMFPVRWPACVQRCLDRDCAWGAPWGARWSRWALRRQSNAEPLLSSSTEEPHPAPAGATGAADGGAFQLSQVDAAAT